MSVAAFDYLGWVARYPEFRAVTPDAAALYFAEAGLYLDNTDASPVRDATVRLMLLNMLTAHIAAMAGANSSSMPGRIGTATEGSVSVTATFDVPPGSAQWYAQTRYGAAYWQASAPYRTMRYIPGCQPSFEPTMPVRPW